MDRFGVPAGSIYRAPEMLDDPHFKARQAIVSVPHPDFGAAAHAERRAEAIRNPGWHPLAEPRPWVSTTTRSICRYWNSDASVTKLEKATSDLSDVPLAQRKLFQRRLRTNDCSRGCDRPCIIVDFVMAYLTPGSPLYAGVELARDASVRLLAAARAAAIPVLHTNVRFQPGGRDGGVFFRKLPALRCFEAGAHPELAAFDPALVPAGGRNRHYETVCERLFRHDPRLDARRVQCRYPVDQRCQHERLCAGNRVGRLSARFHPAGRAGGRRRPAPGPARGQPVRPAGQIRGSDRAGAGHRLSGRAASRPPIAAAGLIP